MEGRKALEQAYEEFFFGGKNRVQALEAIRKGVDIKEKEVKEFCDFIEKTKRGDLPRVTGRGFAGGGKLEAGLDASLEGEVVAVFEIVVTDSGGEGTEQFEDSVEVDPWGHGVVSPYLSVVAKLEGAAAVVGLDVRRTKGEVVYV